MNADEAAAACADVIDEVGAAVIADRELLETVLTALLAEGHVLLEDVPGTGKTLTARSFADALDLSFKRVQFTPDLLPADITGSNVYDEADGSFEFNEGPVFANVVLADEINRAPPKTQAALLEAMGERQVTVDGVEHTLPDPFFVIATQNPVEQEGTFRLPEAQRDRFMFKTSLGYPPRAGERELLDRRADRTAQTPSVEPAIDPELVSELQATAEAVRVSGDLRDYIVDLARATREDDRVEVGVSPRGIQRTFEAARATALVAGREFVVPDDVKRVVPVVFVHRLVLTPEADVRGDDPGDVVAAVLESVPVPHDGSDAGAGAAGESGPEGSGRGGASGTGR